MTDDPTLDEFRVLLDSHGTQLLRWPMPLRSRVRSLLTDPAYRAVWDQAIALEAVLDCWSVPSSSSALIERVVATAPSRRRRRRLLWPLLAAAAALSGIAVGSVAAAAIAPHPERSVDTTHTAFGSLDEEVE
jgi:hypothetical protein